MVKTQTSWYAKVDDSNLSAGRLQIQFGTAKFAARKKTLTLTTELHNVVGFSYAYKYGRPLEAKATALLLTCSGTVAAGSFVRITRTTGGAKYQGSAAASAGTFWYELVGW